MQIKIKPSFPVPSSASSWWPSSAYFPLVLFRLVLSVCEETEEKEQSPEKSELSTQHEAGRFAKLLLSPRSVLGRMKMSTGDRYNKEVVGCCKKVSANG